MTFGSIREESGTVDEPLRFSGAHRWAIVLAGGEGSRLQPFIHRRLGADYPKQYCRFVGTRSMLQHTLDRAAGVVPAEHVVLVIGFGHRKYLDESTLFNFWGTILEQPMNRGTAPGVLLPLMHILHHDPDAGVTILPSDHYVHPEPRFTRHLEQAFLLAEATGDRIVLSGAVPDRPETDYSWIAPGRELLKTAAGAHWGGGPRGVVGFIENPGSDVAQRLFKQGWLWNTMVTTSVAQALWEEASRHVPHVTGPFEKHGNALKSLWNGQSDQHEEHEVLHGLYRDMPAADFSRDILQYAVSRSAVLPMDCVHWCDWSRPERIAETLRGSGVKLACVPDAPGRRASGSAVAQ